MCWGVPLFREFLVTFVGVPSFQSMYESMRRKYISMSSFEAEDQPKKTPSCVYNVPNMAATAGDSGRVYKIVLVCFF